MYLKNTLRLIGSRMNNELQASVFLSPDENEKFGAELLALVDGGIIVDSAIAESGRGRSLVGALLKGQDTPLSKILRANGIDVVFETAAFYGARFPIPVISWMPDFQHAHMPEMFTHANRWRRNLGFRAQIAAGRTIMLSSETARDDLERFYPSARGRGHVVRFAIPLDIARYLGRGDEMRAAYELPERFCYLPNQFWRHKNHGVVIDSLAKLRAAGVFDEIPPIILSGRPEDPRHPRHFEELMSKASKAGVAGHFRYLGLIPYDHVLSLTGCCERLINPSRFEGWSTPIEEAKAFGTPLVLSDIPIHREQAPHARFFDPLSVDDAAQALLDCARTPPPPRPALAELIRNQNERIDAHATALLAVTRAAIDGQAM
ncbi:glycosyltransferase [Methylocystis sp. H4A]|uniref:glycosyltransferase n=1 Tax=Methylocystis sp. H4A TaxID=2785788 RepID=UPI0018C2B75B|nr:glycosyltransferase [Methylocystis sp. H4A]